MPQALPSKMCFVVGPIGAEDSADRIHSDWLLHLVIEPVMAAPEFSAYEVKRADKLSQPGMIDTQIITMLRDADLVIADLSMVNANAFYEIGIRHMVAKPIIHMQLAEQSIPFDVSIYRAVKFSLRRPQDLDVARSELTKQVREAILPSHVVDNPVTRALGQKQFEQTALPEFQLLAGEIAFLKSAISDLQRAQQHRGRISALETAAATAALNKYRDRQALTLATLGVEELGDVPKAKGMGDLLGRHLNDPDVKK